MRSARPKPGVAPSRFLGCLPPRGAALILAAMMFLLSGGAADCAEEAASRSAPNIVLIFTDDQGYQDVGCFGAPKIKTPNLDRMAAEGMKFTDFYVGSPVCSASRASLLTGCYCARVSVTGVFFPERSRQGLHPDEITIAEVLKPRGYATACIGKWHLGDEEPFLPTRQGFDYYYGIPYSNDMAIERDGRRGPPLMRNEEIIEHPAEQATLTKRYTEEALRFIEANRQRPFFLYLPHTMPHVPLFASEKFRGTSAGGLYGDVIEEIDWSVGRILDKLGELSLAERTLVIFTSDSGPWLGKGAHGGSALPLRDGKFTQFEGGMRVPCLMWWPGRIPAGTVCSEVAATMDLLPTFARLAGAETPRDRTIDGKDIWPLMAGGPGAKSPHEVFCYQGRAIRWGKWKLHLPGANQSVGDTKEKLPLLLFDLENDIGETTNLAEQHPETVERLLRRLQEHNAEIAANRRPVGKFTE
jgi:arylsulfatase A